MWCFRNYFFGVGGFGQRKVEVDSCEVKQQATDQDQTLASVLAVSNISDVMFKQKEKKKCVFFLLEYLYSQIIYIYINYEEKNIYPCVLIATDMWTERYCCQGRHQRWQV